MFYAYGMKIEMTKFHNSSMTNNEGRYGIKTLNIYKGGHELILRPCDEDK